MVGECDKLAGGRHGILSAEIEQLLKRYPYFPAEENMDAIGSHPTPATLPAGWKNIEAPAPRGAGAFALLPHRQTYCGGGVT